MVGGGGGGGAGVSPKLVNSDFPQISTKQWHKWKTRFRSYFAHRQALVRN